MVAANTNEVSTFRWSGSAPESVSYDYRLDASIKTKQRHLKVDWPSKQATVCVAPAGISRGQYAARIWPIRRGPRSGASS
jgi:hypothetical protein